MRSPGGKTFRFGDFELEAADYRLTRSGIEIPLRPKPFETLLYLVERHGHLVEKSELLDALWEGAFVGDGALTRCIKEIRKALGDDARDPLYIQTRSGIGYSFIAEVEDVSDDERSGGVASTPAAGPEGAGETRPRRSHWAVLTAAAAGVVAAVLVWQFVVLARERSGEEVTGSPAAKEALPADRPMIAVLPFENLGPEEQVYFAVGMSDEIMTRLAAFRELGVISHTTVYQYDRAGKTVPEIGRDLAVDYVLEGSVLWERAVTGELYNSGRVRITPQLIRVSDDSHVWARSYERQAKEVFAVQSEIAGEVARQLGVALGESERGPAGGGPTDNLDAYRAYLLARYHAGQPHFTIDNWQRVIAYYEEAVELDPAFSLAWAELGRAHAKFYYLKADLSDARREKAARAVDQALDLAPESTEARTALAYHALWVESDRKTARRELQAVERRRPNDVEVLGALATLLRAEGHWAEARRLFERSWTLSPRDPWLALELAYVYWPTRDYEKAVEACEASRMLLPDPAWRGWPNLTKAFVHWSWKADLPAARAALEEVPADHEWSEWSWLWQEILEGRHEAALRRLEAIPDGWIRTKIVARPTSLFAAMIRDASGDREAALSAYREARKTLEIALKTEPDDPRLLSSYGIALAAAGATAAAIEQGQRAVELFPMSKDAFYGVPQVIDMAHIYLLAGREEAALDEIEFLMRVPSWFSPAWLEIDPRWRTLRDTPRFARLLAAADRVS